MASTRGTDFIGRELMAQVAGNYDRRIAELEQEINDLNALTVAERHAAWRAAAEAQVSDLFRRINEATDAELSKFSISSPPYPGEFKYAIGAKETEIARLGRAKEKALAFISALAAGPDGVVTLYAADLKRIGYQP